MHLSVEAAQRHGGLPRRYPAWGRSENEERKGAKPMGSDACAMMEVAGLGLKMWAWGIEEGRLETPVTDTDRRDIAASLGGDGDAFARLVARYQAEVFKQMWRFSRDPGVHDELVQQVFVEVYRSLRGYRERAPFLHWLRRIATRVGYRYWKQEARDRRLQAAVKFEADVSRPPEEQDPSEAAELLHTFLAQLKPKDRLVLSLMYFEGCDGQEIAKRTGWSRGTGKTLQDS